MSRVGSKLDLRTLKRVEPIFFTASMQRLTSLQGLPLPTVRPLLSLAKDGAAHAPKATKAINSFMLLRCHAKGVQ